MAAYTTVRAGKWSDTVAGVTPWSTAGVTPGEGDTVILTHEVTVDGTYIIGSDPASQTGTAAIAVNSGGTLKASRTVSSKLTCKGPLAINSGGTLDYGLTSDRIPAAYTAEIVVNYSASLAADKFWIQAGFTTTFTAVHMNGAVKTPYAALVADAAAAQKVIRVVLPLGATDWSVGDVVGVSPSDVGGVNRQDCSAITAITLVSGTTYDVTLTTNFTYAHATGCYATNLTRNVAITAYSSTVGSSGLVVRAQSGQATASVTLSYVEFSTGGGSTSVTTPLQLLTGLVFATGSNPWGTIEGLAVSDVRKDGTAQTNNNALYGGFALGNGTAGMATAATLTDCVVHLKTTLRAAFVFASGSAGILVRCVVTNTSNGFLASNGSAATGAVLTDCRAYGCSAGLQNISGIGVTVTGMVIDACTRAIDARSGTMSFTGTLFPTFGQVSGTTGYLNYAIQGAVNDLDFTGTTWPSAAIATRNDVSYLNQNNAAIIRYYADGGDTTIQQELTNKGACTRDNSTVNRGKSSIRLEPTVASTARTKTITFIGTSGVAFTIIGYYRYDATFDGGLVTRPSATLSGVGCTATATATSSALGAWEKFTLTDTPSSTGTVTLTLSSGTTTVTTGKVYFDGLPDGRFTQFCRHYGYTFDVTNIQRTTDSFITTATEATVAAYTGIAINHSTSTLTITVAHTLKEIYDYCKYNLCLSANHAYADFFTTGDGVNFTCNYNLSIDGVAVTGTASTLTVLTGKTAGVINSGSLVSARIISVTSGDTGSVVVSSIPAGTSLALYDNSGTQQVYTSSPGTTYTRFMTLPETGTWKCILKKPGYDPQIASFDANSLVSIVAAFNEKIAPSGSSEYTASSSALLDVTFTGTTQGNIDIGEGTVTYQEVFDECEVAMATSAGMTWLAASLSEVAKFSSFGGNYVFLPTKWRLRRRAAGNVNATLGAFAISADGTPTDSTNGSVAYLTSDTATQVAAAVMAYVIETGSTMLQTQQRMAAKLCGKNPGAGTDVETFKGIGIETLRITESVTASGERTAVAFS